METEIRKYASPLKLIIKGERMKKKELVLLWHQTQMGNIKVCQAKQQEFADIMWKLYEEYKEVE